MTERNIMIDSASVSTSVIVTILAAYVFYRSMVASTSTFNIIRGKSRSIASLMLRVGVLSSAVYNITLYFLSTKFQIDKISLELFGVFDKKYIVKYHEYTIDLGAVLISSLRIADILFISLIFISISILTPNYNHNTGSKSNSKISLISKFWAITRIPVVYYSSTLGIILNEKLALFMMLLFYNAELVMASVLLVMLKFKSSTPKSPDMDTGFLLCSIFLYGFLKYSINYIDFPFKINSSMLNLIYSFQYALLISIYLMICGIVYPRSKTIQDTSHALVVPENVQNGSVTMLEEVIEFAETSKPKMIS